MMTMPIKTFAGVILDDACIALLDHYHQLAADALQPLLDGVPMDKQAEKSLAVIAAIAIEEARLVIARADGGSSSIQHTPGITS